MSYEALKLSHYHVGPNPTTPYRSYHYIYGSLESQYLTIAGVGTVISNRVIYQGMRATVIGFTYTIPAPYPGRVTVTYAEPGKPPKQAQIIISNYWTAIYQIPPFVTPFRLTGFEPTRMWWLDTEAKDANLLLQIRTDEWMLFMDSANAQDRFSDSYARLVLRLEDMENGYWIVEIIEANTANTFSLHLDPIDLWTNIGGAANNHVREHRTIMPTLNPLWSLYKVSLDVRDVIASEIKADPQNAWQLPI